MIFPWHKLKKLQIDNFIDPTLCAIIFMGKKKWQIMSIMVLNIKKVNHIRLTKQKKEKKWGDVIIETLLPCLRV
jgi:hypothetical protein